MRTPPLPLIVLALTSGFAAGACRVSFPNPEHCFYAQGDETCATVDPSRPFCVPPSCSSESYGCTAELPTEPSCYSPCGGELTSEDDSSCIEVADDSGSEGDQQPDMPAETDDTEGECHFHADCPPEAGFCFFGVCTPCDGTSDPDSACHVLTDGQAPICLNGDCVQCTEADVDECIDAELACDTETHTCIACTAHDQCPGGAACDIPLGMCLPADAVFHVDGDGGQDFTSIATAVAALDGGSGTVIVHEYDSDDYLDDIVISGDRSVALFAADGELPLLYFIQTSLDVSGGARVQARGLLISGYSGGVESARVRVTGDSYIDFDSCSLYSVLDGNALLLEDSELHMRNTMVSTEGGSIGLHITPSSYVNIAYSTFVALSLDPIIQCTSSLNVGSIMRNSVLLNEWPSAIDCSSLQLINNVVGGPTLYNTSVGELDIGWFALDQFLGDLHLTNLAPVAFSNTAIWEPGDPTVDFDGDPRPARDGSPDFAGADRLP